MKVPVECVACPIELSLNCRLRQIGGTGVGAVATGSMLAVERIEAELFTDGGNDAVVRLPGRKFPGVLVQGDSLSVLRARVAELRGACVGEGDESPLELADEIIEDLDALLRRYTNALERHGIGIPF